MAMRTKNAARKNHGLGAALAVVLWTLAAAGCGEGADVAPSEPFTAHGEASDFAPVILDVGKADALAAQFDANRLMAQNFFLATDLIDGPALQAFFEATPYGTRSWLADEQIADGTPVAAAIVAASRAAGVNPIVMVARMQVEKSLVSATVRPRRAHDVDFAFGCGCPDGQSCAEVYRGLDRQIECAATTLRRLHDGSVAGTAQWRAGHPRKTLDPVTVTPANHATAALYAYTPWVLEGRGGGWLVWNITRRYAQAFVAAGAFAMDDPRLADPFVGTPCATDRDCLFADGAALGFCLAHLPEAAEDDAPPVASGPWTPLGFCALPCEGYCPDRAGDAPTFCASLDGLIGLCLPQSHRTNDDCRALRGTVPTEVERFVGASGAPARTSTVCSPAD